MRWRSWTAHDPKDGVGRLVSYDVKERPGHHNRAAPPTKRSAQRFPQALRIRTYPILRTRCADNSNSLGTFFSGWKGRLALLLAGPGFP